MDCAELLEYTGNFRAAPHLRRGLAIGVGPAPGGSVYNAAQDNLMGLLMLDQASSAQDADGVGPLLWLKQRVSALYASSFPPALRRLAASARYRLVEPRRLAGKTDRNGPQ